MTIVTLIFLGILVIVTIAMMVAFYYLRKGIRFVKKMVNGEMTEEEFQRMANKYYKKKDQNDAFDKDYFKGSGKNRKQQQSSGRTTRTADGVTIVDNRRPEDANKKIFAHDEGEYVDFKEA